MREEICANQYHCPQCEVTWVEDFCDSEHDDKCPVCNIPYTPEKSDWYFYNDATLERVRWEMRQ